MKGYWSFFRIRFVTGLQYRIAAYAGVTTQIAWGFLEIFLFRAFYDANPAAFPMEFSQLSAYVWLQQAFLALFMTWFFDNEVFESIASGSIAYELTRPMDLYSMWFVKNLASRFSKAVLRCAPVLLIAFLVPAPFGLSLPASPVSFLLFLLTMVVGVLVVVGFGMLVYILSFYTISSVGIRMVALSLTEFLTGAIVPLPFLPEPVQAVIGLTPFAAMQNLPLRVYSGNLAGVELAGGILLQVLWLAVLLAGGRLWMGRALKRVVVQGG